MGGLFGNFGGNCGGMHTYGNDKCCSLIFLLLLINSCGCNSEYTWLILLMLLCNNNCGNDCGCHN